MHCRGAFSLVIIYYVMYGMVFVHLVLLLFNMSCMNGIWAFSLVIIYYLMYAWYLCISLVIIYYVMYAQYLAIQSCYYLVCDVCMVFLHLVLLLFIIYGYCLCTKHFSLCTVFMHLVLLLFIMSCMHGRDAFSLVIIYCVMYAWYLCIQSCYYLLFMVFVHLVLLLFIIDFLLLVIGY